MDVSRADTSELREELRRRERIFEFARRGPGSTAELERGIESLREELAARAARLASPTSGGVPVTDKLIDELAAEAERGYDYLVRRGS